MFLFIMAIVLISLCGSYGYGGTMFCRPYRRFRYRPMYFNSFYHRPMGHMHHRHGHMHHRFHL